MKVLALIPARGGSKQIPGKNIRPLGGRPLIQWTLDCARASGSFDRIVVSTDSPEIADSCRLMGCEVPWLRPADLARDDSPRELAVFHCLEKLSAEGYKPDAVMLLQPTSPLRSPGSIREALRIFRDSGGESVVSVCAAANHPLWCKKVADDGRLFPFVEGVVIPACRQELPPAFVLSGSIFLASMKTLESTRGFYSNATRGLVLPRNESVDIDEDIDWLLAEALLASQQRA